MDARSQTTSTMPATERRPPPPSTFWSRNENMLLGTIAVVVFLAFWELTVAAGWINPLFISSPSRIAVAAYALFVDGSIYEDLQVSGFEFLVGYVHSVGALPKWNDICHHKRISRDVPECQDGCPAALFLAGAPDRSLESTSKVKDNRIALAPGNRRGRRDPQNPGCRDRPPD